MSEPKTSDTNNDERQPPTVVSKLSGLIGLYAVFVYLSGWTFLDYYYRSFGLNTTWLDISITETLMKGFIILFEGGQRLWFIYVFVVVVPVLFEVFPRLRVHILAQIGVACLMLSCLPIAYYISKSAGEEAAAISQGTQTALPDVSFEMQCGRAFKKYVGKLLYVKNGFYYLHRVQPLEGETGEQKKSLRPESALAQDACPIPKSAEIGVLTVLRSEVVRELQIVETSR
jgi:hypothetical protein